MYVRSDEGMQKARMEVRRALREGIKNLIVAHVRKRGGGQPPVRYQLFFFNEKKMQNVLKRKKKYLDKSFCEIYSFGPSCFIKMYIETRDGIR